MLARDTRCTLETPELRRLHQLWEDKRGVCGLPARRDFDPVDLKFVLGRLLLLDVLPGPRFRFRLHGAELARVAGYDMTGKWVEDLPNEENRQVLLARCSQLLAERKPVTARMRRPLEGRRYNYEALWLPLADDGLTVNMLFAGLIYLDDWRQAIPEREDLEDVRATLASHDRGPLAA